MEDNRILQLVYTFFVGILIAIFVGVGIDTFYTSPPAPEYPQESMSYAKEPTPEQEQKSREFEKQMRQHDEKMKPYNRNVSMMTLGAAVLLLALSIAFEKKIKIISDGIMLGGLFSLLYGIGRGLASQDSKYMFVMVSISLVVVLYLGYHRFVKLPSTKTKASQV